ncbi:alpha-ketoacid dehydrogenase subunit beta [Conexibacter sp. CPCC 206217]|uniref:alpha-ketoacid dehydrogenase subunit beta n=1 Tax=Conexibacter sp. CPCC 206217 TaxID=3064574 RepID=UPI0027219F33|nr:transketolase C-terminal domain-containing protein [Conexibacter sp. CPCC 206217]MDO8210325.1 transketolase C-terminal domain-containing protein [Conexibacter sp. CPCC 206217]
MSDATEVRQLTYAAAFREGVQEEMERDERVFVLGTDLVERGGHFAQVLGLGAEFGTDRIRDTPISEAAMVAAGVGAALYGMRPLVDLNFMEFAFGAMDEIVNQAAKMSYMFGRKVPLVIRGTSGVALSGAQHNNTLEMMFAQIPGLAVAVPSAPADAKGLIKTALRGEDPVIFMMHKRLSGVRGPVDGDADALVPFGQLAVVREGGDCTVVAYGANVLRALRAADELAAQGVELEVLDLRTLWPLDRAGVLASVARTGRAVVVDEAPLFGSIASEIAALVQEQAFDRLSAPVQRVCGARAPTPFSPPLIEANLPQPQQIVAAVQRTLA